MVQNYRHVTLMLTYKCNQACPTCGQVHSRRRLDERYNNLPIDLIKERMNALQSVQTVYLFGGEPFIYPDIKELLIYLKQRGIRVLITTNAVNIDEYFDIIFDYVDDLSISLDTHIREDYKALRNSDSFNTVINNMDRLFNIRANRTANAMQTKVGINCVVSEKNMDYLQNFLQFIKKRFKGVDRVNFESLIDIPQMIGIEYEKELKRTFNCQVQSWRWFHNQSSNVRQENLDLLWRKIGELRNDPMVTFLMPNNKEEFYAYYLGKNFVTPHNICRFPFNGFAVLPNGDVTYCVDFPDYIIGNIYINSIQEILSSKESKAFLQYLVSRDGANLPICSRCPRIFNINNSIA